MNKNCSDSIDEFSEALSTAKKELRLESLQESQKECHLENDLYIMKVKYFNEKYVVLTIVFDKHKKPFIAKYFRSMRTRDTDKSEIEDVIIVYYRYKSIDQMEKMTGEEVERIARSLRHDENFTLLRIL